MWTGRVWCFLSVCFEGEEVGYGLGVYGWSGMRDVQRRITSCQFTVLAIQKMLQCIYSAASDVRTNIRWV